VYARGAVVRLDGVPQSTIVQFYTRHAAACALHRLRNRDRHFTRLAVAETDLAVAVTDHGERRETHLPTALDRLGHAVDGDQFLQHAIAVFTFVRRHLLSPFLPPACRWTFACGWAAWSCYCGLGTRNSWRIRKSSPLVPRPSSLLRQNFNPASRAASA